MSPSISESSEIPKRKKVIPGWLFGLRPLFTGQLFIVGEDLPRGDSRGATEMCGAMDLAFALWLHESQNTHAESGLRGDLMFSHRQACPPADGLGQREPAG